MARESARAALWYDSPSDASRWPHNILLNLRLRGGALTGMASAQTTTDPVYFALTSYVALSRKATDK